MSREIKFRAWDKTYNLMNYKVQVGNTDYADKNYTCNSIWVDYGDIKNIGWMNADDKCIDLMQYTGLKDKNGVEIYEGDIIQFKYVYSGRIWDKQRFENEPEIRTEKVIYRDGMFTIGYRLPIKIAGDNYPYSERNENHAMTWTETYSEFEVIGNIHQNPELL